MTSILECPNRNIFDIRNDLMDCFIVNNVREECGNVLDLILSSQYELVDNVKVHEPLGSNDHNQIHFNIKVKTENAYKKQWRRNFNKGKYKEMRTYLANTDWSNLLKNKTATECWTCLKYEIEGIIVKFFPTREKVQEETPVKRGY